MAQSTKTRRQGTQDAVWKLLCNAESHDSQQCTVGRGGPTCYIVQNAVRVLGDLKQAAVELAISPEAAAQAVEYAERWPRKPTEAERDLFAHAAAALFTDA